MEGVWAKWAKVIKRYKLPVTGKISPMDIIYRMVIIVSNIVLYI